MSEKCEHGFRSPCPENYPFTGPHEDECTAMANNKHVYRKAEVACAACGEVSTEVLGRLIAAAEERGRDELWAALKAAENDRDTWKRLCEKADAQATAATVRANKLAAKRGYDLDDDAEERGRRRGVEERDELRDRMHQTIAFLLSCVASGEKLSNEEEAGIRAMLREGLAPRDSGKVP